MRYSSYSINSVNTLTMLIFSYAFVLSIFVNDGARNYLVLLAATAGSIVYFIIDHTIRKSILYGLALFICMLINVIFLDGFRAIGTVALTLLYAMGYFVSTKLIYKVRNKRLYMMKILRIIIFSFFFVSLLQMIASLFGLPIPNEIASKGLWSYNSLSFEPSQLGRVVGLTMLCYMVIIRNLEGGKVDLKLAMAFLGTMLLSGSTLAIAAIFTVFLLIQSTTIRFLVLILSIFFAPFLEIFGFDSINRLILFIQNLSFTDLSTLMQSEASGAIRIASLVIYLNELDITELGFWFGYGNQGLENFFLGKIPGLGDDLIASGFLPGFSVSYGFIFFIFFVWVFLVRFMNIYTLPLIIFWLMFYSTSAWNTQVFWYGLILIKMTWIIIKPEKKLNNKATN